MSCSFFLMRCDVVARGPFGPGFNGVFAKEQSNCALTHGRHGHSPEHLILRNEHTSLQLWVSQLSETITRACDLPSPCFAHHWLPLLTQPVESSPNRISPGGPWLKRAKLLRDKTTSRQDHA